MSDHDFLHKFRVLSHKLSNILHELSQIFFTHSWGESWLELALPSRGGVLGTSSGWGWHFPLGVGEAFLLGVGGPLVLGLGPSFSEWGFALSSRGLACGPCPSSLRWWLALPSCCEGSPFLFGVGVGPSWSWGGPAFWEWGLQLFISIHFISMRFIAFHLNLRFMGDVGFLKHIQT